MVIICCKENEDKAHLVTVFDKYRVAHPFIPPVQDIKNYLQNHFVVGSHLVKPAALVDPERCLFK